MVAGDLSGAERMLRAQAQTLDAIFNQLAITAANAAAKCPDTFDRQLRLALKAQSQCRTTLETLANIKNPPVVFAKQANFAAGHQQVNNAATPCAHGGKTESGQNELLEVADGEWMDSRAEGSAGRGDPAVATVVPIDRAEDGRRKGSGKP